MNIFISILKMMFSNWKVPMTITIKL